MYSIDGRMWFDEKAVSISGNTISVQSYANASVHGNGTTYDSTANNIKIIEVIGYKD